MDILEKITLSSGSYLHYLTGSSHWLPAWGAIADSIRAHGYDVTFVYEDGHEELATGQNYRPLVVSLKALKLTRGAPCPP